MLDELRVRQLVEEALDSERTPEEVCRDSPALLSAVRARWLRARDVQAELERVFPAAGTRVGGARPGETLPRIPGHEVEALQGRGGMGVVYRARDLRLGRLVAIKMLLAGEHAGPRELARFRLEAQAIAGLRHANLVQVHDVGELEGRPYYTMEFVEGGSLAARLAGTPQPAAAACALVATLCEAVQVAHDGGIIHRDLKPANVLLTAEGIPKITDFGLARRLNDGPSFTASGVALGTPSYMAPEQVEGPAGGVGPAADVYALGAILYEMLTGRPPFRAESALATQMQVVSQDPVAPSRLNAAVARDLETICLKCLHKDPARRYASAAALAEDLRGFQRGEPIAARRTGRLERTAKWVRRRPGQAAALAGGSLLVLAMLAAGLWIALQRAATERSVGADLREVAERELASDWIGARTALERAKARIGAGGPRELHERVEQFERDLALVTRLDAIRLQRGAVVEGRFDPRSNNARADADYEAALGAAGWGGPDDDPGRAAERIAASPIRPALVSALDDWAICAAHAAPGRQEWILAVARRADPDPSGWRERVRDPALWKDRATAEELARAADAATASLPCVVALAERLVEAGSDAVPLLQAIQRRHPEDFWANLGLGDALRPARPGESIRYYQAALALRPDAAVVRNNLGSALAHERRFDEALEQFREALRLDPRFAHALSNLGNALKLEGRSEEAIAAYREAIALDPLAPLARTNLVWALADQERLEEAYAEAQQAYALAPEVAQTQLALGLTLLRKGRLDEAIELFRRAIALEPGRHEAHLDLGIALTSKGELDAAIESCRRALELSPSSLAHSSLCAALRLRGRIDEALAHGEEAVRLDPLEWGTHNNLAAALAMSGRGERALEHFREAVRLAPARVDLHNNLGNALGLLGRLAEAAEQYREALRLAPDSAQANGALGQALMGLGRLDEALEHLRRGLALFPPGSSQHRNCAEELRTCGQLLAAERRLPAILAGSEAPASGTEALQLATLCRLRGDHASAARLFAEAFLLAPGLAEDPRTGNRAKAASSAARAGRVRDALVEPGEDERAEWRALAREWLQAEIEALTESLARGQEAASVLARRSLALWHSDPDLSVIREPAELAQLSAEERAECDALWEAVEALRTRVEGR